MTRKPTGIGKIKVLERKTKFRPIIFENRGKTLILSSSRTVVLKKMGVRVGTTVIDNKAGVMVILSEKPKNHYIVRIY